MTLSELRRRIRAGHYVDDRYSVEDLALSRRLLFLCWLLRYRQEQIFG